MQPAAPEESFYDSWANKQLADPRRGLTLRWKAIHLAKLFTENLPGAKVRSICEVGGAEGTVLHNLGTLLGAAEFTNYDISEPFIRLGQQLYPQICFQKRLFDASGPCYDVVILSDITEHVEDDLALLHDVSRRCRFVLLKMPIEKCLLLQPWSYRLRGKRMPEHLIFGPKHYNGHLRGYTVASALRSVGTAFEVIDWFFTDHAFYERPSRAVQLLRSWLGTTPVGWIWGGSLFVLARPRQDSP